MPGPSGIEDHTAPTGPPPETVKKSSQEMQKDRETLAGKAPIRFGGPSRLGARAEGGELTPRLGIMQDRQSGLSERFGRPTDVDEIARLKDKYKPNPAYQSWVGAKEEAANAPAQDVIQSIGGA
jgi:hypothetical protein